MKKLLLGLVLLSGIAMAQPDGKHDDLGLYELDQAMIEPTVMEEAGTVKNPKDAKVGGLPVLSIEAILRESAPLGTPEDVMAEVKKDNPDYAVLTPLFERDVQTSWFDEMKDRLQMKRTIVIGLQNKQMLAEARTDIRMLKEAYTSMSAKIDALVSMMSDFMKMIAEGAAAVKKPATKPTQPPALPTEKVALARR